MSSGGWLTDDQSGTASTGHNGKRLSVARIFIAWRSSDFAADVALQAEPGTTPSVTDAPWGRLLLVSVAHGESKRLFLTSWLACWQGGSRAGGIFSSLRWSSLSVTGTDMLLRKYEKRWFIFNRMFFGFFFLIRFKKNILKSSLFRAYLFITLETYSSNERSFRPAPHKVQQIWWESHIFTSTVR